jgi:hypothetical protein
MKVSDRVIREVCDSYLHNEWRLIKLNLEEDGSLAAIFPEGRWKATEVRCNPDRSLWLYLIADPDAEEGIGLRFVPEEAAPILEEAEVNTCWSWEIE